MELITIAQACELTGKSEHAIRRLIKRLLDTDKQAAEQIKQEPIANGSFRYSIEKKYLLFHLPQPNIQANAAGNTQGNGHLTKPNMRGDEQPISRLNKQDSIQNLQPNAQGYDPLLAAKEEAIEILKNQLTQRDEQIRKKDEQINQLLERDRETNILLKGYQDRFLLEAPKENTRGLVVENHPQSKKLRRKPQQPKKKGFFSWFR